MNPLLFIPFITTPLINAVIAWIATRTNLINHVVSLAPWTTPGPVGAAWSTGWDWRAVVLVGGLIGLSSLIYYPFFKCMSASYWNKKLKWQMSPQGRGDEIVDMLEMGSTMMGINYLYRRSPLFGDPSSAGCT